MTGPSDNPRVDPADLGALLVVLSSCIEANRITPSATFQATMSCRVVSSMPQFLDEFSKVSPEPFRLSESSGRTARRGTSEPRPKPQQQPPPPP